MSRRPLQPPMGRVIQAQSRMAPGGRVWSESPIVGGTHSPVWFGAQLVPGDGGPGGGGGGEPVPVPPGSTTGQIFRIRTPTLTGNVNQTVTVNVERSYGDPPVTHMVIVAFGWNVDQWHSAYLTEYPVDGGSAVRMCTSRGAGRNGYSSYQIWTCDYTPNLDRFDPDFTLTVTNLQFPLAFLCFTTWNGGGGVPLMVSSHWVEGLTCPWPAFGSGPGFSQFSMVAGAPTGPKEVNSENPWVVSQITPAEPPGIQYTLGSRATGDRKVSHAAVGVIPPPHPYVPSVVHSRGGSSIPTVEVSSTWLQLVGGWNAVVVP